MSRRIVISDTSSCVASSAMWIVCSSATRSRIRWRRSTASTRSNVHVKRSRDQHCVAQVVRSCYKRADTEEGRVMAHVKVGAEETGQPQQLFVRRSTGLVREASALDATIFNAVFSAPVGATLAWGVFFALTAFPGSDLVAATLWSVVLNVPILIMMSLLASSMPKTGGDYVWVSRILSPPAAVVSNLGAAFSAIIGATFWARYFPVFALGPVLVTLGTIFNSQDLISAGTHLQTDKGWIFLGGFFMVALMTAIL